MAVSCFKKENWLNAAQDFAHPSCFSGNALAELSDFQATRTKKKTNEAELGCLLDLSFASFSNVPFAQCATSVLKCH